MGELQPSLADILAEPFEPGRTYPIRTISDMIEVCRVLPDDRRELMLAEMLSGIRLAAAHFNLLAAFGAFRAPVADEPIEWVDDNGGEIAINTHTADQEPFISLKAYRDAPTTTGEEG